MKTIIIFLITVSTSLCQSNDSISEVRFSYSKGYSKRNFKKVLSSENIVINLDSIGSFKVSLFTQDSIPFKLDKNQAVARGARVTEREEAKMIRISDKSILNWISELKINREFINELYLKQQSDSISRDDIISIAKKLKISNLLNSYTKTQGEVENHFLNIRNYKYIDEFVESCKQKQMNLKVDNSLDRWDYLYIICTSGNYSDVYRIDFYKEQFSLLYSNFDSSEHNFKSKVCNLEIYRLALNFLPPNSFIKDRFNIKELYINWYLKNKI